MQIFGSKNQLTTFFRIDRVHHEEFHRNPSKGLIFSSKFFSVSIWKKIKTFQIFPFYYNVRAHREACLANFVRPKRNLEPCSRYPARSSPVTVRSLSRETGNKMFVTLLAFPLVFTSLPTCTFHCLHTHFIF